MQSLRKRSTIRHWSLKAVHLAMSVFIIFGIAPIKDVIPIAAASQSYTVVVNQHQNVRDINQNDRVVVQENSTFTNSIYLPLIAGGSKGVDSGLPYLQLSPASVASGHTSTAYGRNFCSAHNCSSVTLTIGNRVITSTVPVNSDGKFQTSFSVIEFPGRYVITATQTTTDNTVLKASAPLLVTRAEMAETSQALSSFPTGHSAQSQQLQPNTTSEVTEFQPNINLGGRTVAISISATNASVAIAATESGGLFQTSNRGVSWTHVNSLTLFRMNDVKIAPGNAQVIIATARADSHTENEGGIWRSSDGGATWQKPATADPPVSPCGNRISAYGIAFLTGTNDVFVGTDCGLAISHDLGTTWSHTVPRPTGTRLTVYDVTVRANTNSSIIDVCTSDGHHRSTDGGVNWSVAGAGLANCFSGYVGTSMITTSPIEQNILFAAAAGPFLPAKQCNSLQAYESDDSGANWTAISDPICPNNPPTIVAHLSRDGDPNHIDVYYGDGISLFRQTCTNTGGPGLRCSTTAWSSLKSDHSDELDVAFNTNDNCPQFMTSDGGMHRTTDCGATWTTTGGGNGGFNALQLYEMTGQTHPNHTDLYIGTQDNYIWASGDNGISWPNNICCEGFSLQISHNSPSDSGQTLTGVACGPCYNFRTDAHLANSRNWHNPPSGGGNPFLVESGVYIQFGSPPTNTLYLSTDTGATWRIVPAANVPQQLISRPYISGSPANPTIYVAASKSTSTGGSVNGLIRISGVRTTTATVNWADNGLISIDSYCNGDGTYVCPIAFGVDPSNPQHLIASDGGAGQMKVSTDGGASWTIDNQLTLLITDNGRLLFNGQVHVIAFDPTNGNRILVGTEAAGVIASTDSGQTWGRIAGSERVTAATSFFFDEVRSIVLASSYGRGLWAIPTQLPIANAGGPYITQEGTDINLDARSSSDPTGGTLTYEWDFDNDGNFNDATGPTPTFDRVGQAGIFTVRLKVTSSVGFAIATTTVTVNNVAPNVNFDTNSPQNEGSRLIISGIVSDPGWLNQLTATVEWGDGVPIEPIGGTLENVRPDATLTFSVTHVYADNGSYTVRVCGTDNNGATTCSPSTVIVNNVPAAVNAGQNQIIYEGDTATFDPATFNDKGTLDTHTATINWGDGSPVDTGVVHEAPFGPPGSIDGANGTVSGQHPYVVSPGIYTVTVTVTDKDGGVGSGTLKITVVPGFLRFCAYADDDSSNNLVASEHLSMIDKWTTLECAKVPGGAPGKTRAGGVGSRQKIEAEDHASIMGDMVSLKDQVVLKGDSTLSGNIAAFGDVELEDRAQTLGNVTTADDILLKNHSVISGNAVAGGTIDLSGGSIVSGTIRPSTSVPSLPRITSVQFALTAGTQDVDVEQGANQSLDPGSYQDLEVGTGATLTLHSGRYAFRQISAARGAIVAFDLANGPVVIDIVNSVELGESVQMLITSSTGDAADILFRIAGSKIHLGEQGVYLGTFLGLDAEAILGQHATLNGALYGDQVQIRERSHVIGQPAVKVFASLFVAP